MNVFTKSFTFFRESISRYPSVLRQCEDKNAETSDKKYGKNSYKIAKCCRENKNIDTENIF